MLERIAVLDVLASQAKIIAGYYVRSVIGGKDPLEPGIVRKVYEIKIISAIGKGVIIDLLSQIQFHDPAGQIDLLIQAFLGSGVIFSGIPGEIDMADGMGLDIDSGAIHFPEKAPGQIFFRSVHDIVRVDE